MRAIACWPIQYLTAFGIASQSPGYLPNAVYIVAQMTRKRTPAVTIGTRCFHVQSKALPRAARGRGPSGDPTPRTRHQSPYATKRTPVM